MGDHGIVGMLTALLAHLSVGSDATSDDAFQPTQNSLPMVGGRTMIPRTIPLWAVIRYPGISKVVETSIGFREWACGEDSFG